MRHGKKKNKENWHIFKGGEDKKRVKLTKENKIVLKAENNISLLKLRKMKS